jgi:uncharacterized protein (DUF58 family)
LHRAALRRLLSLDRRVWPTARGWQVIFFSALSLLMARLIGTTQIYQLGYALAGLLLAALVIGLFLSRGLSYVRRIPEEERLVAGQPSHVHLMVSNASLTRSPGVEVVDHLPEQLLLQMAPVQGSGTRRMQEPVLFARRGLYELGPAEIQTTDPLGLLRFTRRFRERTEAVVYPEVFELEGFPLRGRSRDVGARGSFAQQGDEFSGLREYRRGDDRRHIHWKSVARTGELIVREFAQSAPRRHTVVLDLHSRRIGAPEVEVEDTVSAAGSVLWHLTREGLPARLLCTDRARSSTAFGAHEATYWRAMDLLALVCADGDVEPGDFLNEKLREEREELGEGVVLVSRSLGPTLVKSVEKLRAAGFSAVVIALAAHTYRSGGASSRHEGAFDEDIRQLELAGADVRVLRRPGGMPAFAGGQRAANTWRVV